MSDTPTATVSCRNVWKIYGPKAGKIVGTPDADLPRAELLEKTGCVAAVRDVSFDVAAGRGLRRDGALGLGQVDARADAEPDPRSDGGRGAAGRRGHHAARRRAAARGAPHEDLDGLPALRAAAAPAHRGQRRRSASRSAASSKEEREQRANEVLETVGLGGWGNSYPDELSGGMQQRVGLARALATDPEIMLFDEPFSALDPLIRRDMQDEVIRLQREVRKTMIFITHDLAEALKLGDRIAIMKDGKFVQVGHARRGRGAPGRRLRRRLHARRPARPRADGAHDHAPGRRRRGVRGRRRRRRRSCRTCCRWWPRSTGRSASSTGTRRSAWSTGPRCWRR